MRFVRILAGAAVLAADPAGGQSYHVRHYTENDGLPNAIVYDVEEGTDGRMWFATRTGVAAYDGVEWQVEGVRDGLTMAPQADLAVDRKGVLWAVTPRGFEVTRHVDGSWRRLPSVPTPVDEVYGLAVEYELDRPRVAVATHDGLFVWDSRNWLFGDPLPDGAVRAVRPWGHGFVAAGDAGVFVLRRDLMPEVPAWAADLPGDVLGLGGGGDELWLAGREAAGTAWIGRVVRDRFVAIASGLPLPPPYLGRPLTVGVDGSGNFFYGSPNVLFRYHPELGPQVLGPASGLVAGGATALCRDREDNLWIAGLRGLSKVVSFRFANYDQGHGLYQNEVSAVLERRDGVVVLGHNHGLTFVHPRGRMTTLPLADQEILSSALVRVLDLAEDDHGDLWVATSGLGLWRLEARGDWQRVIGSADLEVAQSVRVDRRGRVWASGRLGLHQLAGGRFVPVPGAPQVGIRRILTGDGDVLYLAADQGLYLFREGRFRRITSGNRDGDNVFTVLEDPSGEVWVGSIGGLYRLDGDVLRPVTELELDRPVYTLIRDAQGELWLGTDNGVVRWDGERTSHLTMLEGLGGRETNRAAALVDHRGRVWIGTDRGVTVYDRHFDPPRTTPPRLELVQVGTGGEDFPSDVPVVLGPGRQDLHFHFRALSFVDEDRILVRYRLEGLDDGWTEEEASPRREVRYVSVPPGGYRFRLMARSAAGVWSPEVSSAEITISAPYWARPWFYFLAVFAAAGILTLGERYRAQRRQSQLLRVQLENETLKAQKLEAVGLLAGGIAHDFNNLLAAILGHLDLARLGITARSEPAHHLEEAKTAVRRAHELTQRLLTFSRGGTPIRERTSIAELLRGVVAEAPSVLTCRVRLAEDLWPVEVDRNQVRQVLRNLLANAAEAMPRGGELAIRATNRYVEAPRRAPLKPGRYVTLEVEDHGPGISPEHLAQVFDPYFTTKSQGSGMGLAVAYSIVKAHQGLLSVDSKPGRGTTFRVDLPAAPESPVHPAAER